MARLTFLFALFLLFAFSHASFLTADEATADLPESDAVSTTSILLPSERTDFNHDDASDTDSGIGSVPLTWTRFHPVNRHFPGRPFFPFRHKHSCRFHKRFRPLNPRFHQKHLFSYGNDMILSDGRSFNPESNGVVRQIDARWGSFDDDGALSKHHGQDREEDHHHHDNDHEEDHHHHHDHEDHHHELEDDHHDHEHDHEDDHHHHDHDHDHEDDHHHHDHDHEDDHHHHHNHHHHHREKEEGGFMEKFRRFFIHL